MYQRLSDCVSVVAVIDSCEGVSWTLAGKGERFGSCSLFPPCCLLAGMTRGLLGSMGHSLTRPLFASLQPQTMSSAADIRTNIVDQMARCVASLHNRKQPVRALFELL
jgi:hypothetical protein